MTYTHTHTDPDLEDYRVYPEYSDSNFLPYILAHLSTITWAHSAQWAIVIGQ